MKTGGETFLAFNARVVPLAVLIAALWPSLLWFAPPMMEGGFNVYDYQTFFAIAIASGFFYFLFLIDWLIARIRKAKGRHPKTSRNLSFRKMTVSAIGGVILGAFTAGVSLAYNMHMFSVFLEIELIWPLWAPVVGMGAFFYAIIVLEWLSHRVYRVAARKLHPEH